MTVGVDLGSSHVGLSTGSGRAPCREPAVVATDTRTHKVVALGAVASQMWGRTGGTVQVVRPVAEGVAANPDLVAVLLRHVMRRGLGWRSRFRPALNVCVPVGLSDVDREALHDAFEAAGSGAVHLVPALLAAARGAGADVTACRGWMIVDLGASHTQAALIFMGRLLAAESIPVGGDDLDSAVVRYLRQQRELAVSDEQARAVKHELGIGDTSAQSISVTGRDARSGLPATLTLSSDDMRRASMAVLTQIEALVRRVLGHTPAELATDILDNGVLLTGGGARLAGLAPFLYQHINIPVHVPSDPETCAVRGSAAIR